MSRIDQVIETLEDKSLSARDILELVDYETNIMKYTDLVHMHSLDDLFYDEDDNYVGACVLLYETQKNYGHWVCVIDHRPRNGKRFIEFFDPYGGKPDSELKYIPDHFAIISGQEIPMLTFLMMESRLPIIYNNTRLQGRLPNVNTCGRHVTLRLIFRHIPLKKYIEALKSESDPDFTVTLLTILA